LTKEAIVFNSEYLFYSDEFSKIEPE